MNKLLIGSVVCSLAGFAAAGEAPAKPGVSGIYPHLAMYDEEGECGTGAVVPWADRLWVVTYPPHSPGKSSNKLYEITPELERVTRPESIGGTVANRMIHEESDQLFIGPYAIDGDRKVRVIPHAAMPGRLTANMRHLTDPTNKLYFATMEEGFYEVDVHTLAVTELYEDGNTQAHRDGDLLPGYHGKGAYSGQGRVVYANNGELSPAAQRDPSIASGVLAEWDGKTWRVIRRNQFTEVTGPGGIVGAAHPERDPIWSVGWDYRSLMLMVLDSGAWHCYRLPKGSHSYDGAHGWNTEWPRIRETEGGDWLLMTMHGTFWRFPKNFDGAHAAGIAPISNYLKVIGDFCLWNGQLVFGCDDCARDCFLNKRSLRGSCQGPRRSNSNLWFVKPEALAALGPAIGRGAVWMSDAVTNGIPSDPYLFDGYARRTLYLAHGGNAEVSFRLEADVEGNNTWTVWRTLAAKPGAVSEFAFAPTERAAWIRLVPLADAKDVTAYFQYAAEDTRGPGGGEIARGLAPAGAAEALGGIVYSDTSDLALAAIRAADKKIGFYRLTPELKLVRSERPNLAAKAYGMDGRGATSEAASILIVDDAGKRWRLPYGSSERKRTFSARRLCREVSTERDLMNVGGTFYEVPAENAGGFAKMRPIATHNLAIHDYCGWRGLLVMTGIDPRAADSEHVIFSADRQAAVWIGAIDDLWSFGKPRGQGGPWRETEVAADASSDPYLMTGFDEKRLTLRETGAATATFTLELDLTGTGYWKPYRTYRLHEGRPTTDDLTATRAYWLRLRSDTACKATALLDYGFGTANQNPSLRN